MRVISVANDDIVYQDGGSSYVRGYSGGAQRAWLAHELALARADRRIDWIVVVMHQVAISTVDQSTARISASGRNGSRCSINTASTSWSAGMSTITSARTRSAVSK